MKHGRDIDGIKNNANAQLALKVAEGNRLVEKWSQNPIGYGIGSIYSQNAQKARTCATLLENQERHLKQLNEAIISQNFQTTPENVLKIVRLGTANSCRGEIFTEVPLSTVDDAIYYVDTIYEQTLRDGVAGEKTYEKSKQFYASEQEYKAVTATVTDVFTLTANKFPVIPNRVFVQLNGRLIGYDDGNGVIIPLVKTGAINLKTTGITATYQTVVYSTGVIKLEFDANLAITDDVEMLTNFDSELTALHDQLGTISLTISKRRFDARPRPLGYNYTQMTEVTLGTTMGLDAEALLVGAIGDEHARSKDYRAVAFALSIAKQNAIATFDCTVPTTTGETSMSHSQKLLPAINQIGGALLNDIKRGKVNKAIVGTDAWVYMQKQPKWTDDLSMTRTGVFKAGRYGDIDVYVCPTGTGLIETTDILLTFKNPNEGLDVGCAFGVLTELSAALTYPEMYKVGYIASVEDELNLNSKMVRLLQLTNFVL